MEYSKKSTTRLYRIWNGMRQRCYNPNCRIYYKYGAKGVTVCDLWNTKYQYFYDWALANGYNDNLTIDRIDNSRGYCPENCRWATYVEQNSHLAKPITNTSGYVGVSWSKKENKWISNISVDGKSVRIGCFNTQKEAVEARNKFVEENHLLRQKIVYTGEKGKRS